MSKLGLLISEAGNVSVRDLLPQVSKGFLDSSQNGCSLGQVGPEAFSAIEQPEWEAT